MDRNDIVISFEHVTKTYRLYDSDKKRFLALFLKGRIPCKKYKALNDVSFTVRRGESLGIVGRNGAGKSTLLKAITGVTFPEKGTVTVNGQVSALLELAAGCDPEMTGRENIYLKGYILGLSDSEISELEGEIVEFAELDDYIDQPVRTYSSGMKARLGFAVNANVRPDILVIDEALSVGDAAFGEKCRQKVKSIIEEGATVLFVSHSKDKVKEFCDRAILLEKGTLIDEGDTDYILERYEELLKKVRAQRQAKRVL